MFATLRVEPSKPLRYDYPKLYNSARRAALKAELASRWVGHGAVAVAIREMWGGTFAQIFPIGAPPLPDVVLFPICRLYRALSTAWKAVYRGTHVLIPPDDAALCALVLVPVLLGIQR